MKEKPSITPADISVAIKPIIQPWLDRNLIPEPIPVISIARAAKVKPEVMFDVLAQDASWFSIDGTTVKTQLKQTINDLRNQSLRQLRMQVPRNKDKAFTTFIWGEKNRAVVYRSRHREPNRQSYLPEVKARTKVIFVSADSKQEAQQQRLTQRQATKQRLAKRWAAKNTPSPESPPLESDWLSLCQNPEAIDQLPANAILSIGFGIDATVPLRVASYPLLTAQLLRRYPQASLEMYVATQFSWLRNLNQDNTAANAQLLQNTINQFFRIACPDLTNRINFIPTQPLTPNRLQFIDQMARILSRDRQLNDFANSRDGFNSLRYLAAHSLYMRDPLPIDPNLYLTPLPIDNRPVVMIGGDGEKVTWRARQQIAQYFKVTPPLQIFTTLGRIPPYFRCDQEPIVGQPITTSFLTSTSPEVYRDYTALLIALARNSNNEFRFDLIDARINQRQQFLSQPSIQTAIDQLNQFIKL